MRSRSTISVFIAISLLIHLLFLILISRIDLKGLEALNRLSAKKNPVVEVDLVKKKYQIADISPPEKEERPEDAKFLGLYDSKVNKEQVAATPLHASRKGEGTQQGEKAEKSGHEELKNKEGEGKRLALKSPERNAHPLGEGDEILDSLPEDFYPNYKIGNKTYLNVLKFPKIGYFVRLKKIFKTTFNPVPAIRPYFYANQVSRGQVEVVLGVSIDKKGDLSELFVINSSGLDLYDKEALRTIRQSSPFATPPTDLLDKDSQLRMVWTFTVYL